jgi:hypothetical protein
MCLYWMRMPYVCWYKSYLELVVPRGIWWLSSGVFTLSVVKHLFGSTMFLAIIRANFMLSTKLWLIGPSHVCYLYLKLFIRTIVLHLGHLVGWTWIDLIMKCLSSVLDQPNCNSTLVCSSISKCHFLWFTDSKFLFFFQFSLQWIMIAVSCLKSYLVLPLSVIKKDITFCLCELPLN